MFSAALANWSDTNSIDQRRFAASGTSIGIQGQYGLLKSLRLHLEPFPSVNSARSLAANNLTFYNQLVVQRGTTVFGLLLG